MLCLVHLIFGILGVVREPRLPLRVVDRLGTDVALRVDDPLGNIMAHGSGNRNIAILRHHPRKEFVAHLALEQLVVSNINQLDKPRAPSRMNLTCTHL
jgi:hypothetical protein